MSESTSPGGGPAGMFSGTPLTVWAGSLRKQNLSNHSTKSLYYYRIEDVWPHAGPTNVCHFFRKV